MAPNGRVPSAFGNDVSIVEPKGVSRILGVVVVYLMLLSWSAHWKMDHISEVIGHNDTDQKIQIMNQHVNEQCSCPYKTIIPVEHLEKAIDYKINKYDADKISKMDFALEAVGGKVVAVRDSRTYNQPNSAYKWMLSKFFNLACDTCELAKAVIQPEVAIGHGWSFEGSEATLVIRLARRIFINGLTVDHIAESISPTKDISSAPKEFSFMALEHKDDDEGYNFGNFIFEKDQGPIQQFVVRPPPQAYDLVSVHVKSNWGNDKYTTIYRIRVHGTVE